MAKPHLAELCRAHFPRPVVLVMRVLMEGVAMATDLAEFLGADLPAEPAEPFRLSQPITAVDRPPVITKS